MTRTVYRSWIQTVILSICMCTFLLIGVAMFTSGWAEIHDDPASIALYGVITLGALWGLYLALRMGVMLDDRGIHYRAFGRGSFLPWERVTGVSCEVYDARAGLSLYAPVVQVVSETEGGQVEATPLAALGSYSQATAQRRTELIAARLGREP